MSKILVTGCAGYIGSTLVPMLLERGHEVVGVDNFTYNNELAMISFISHPNFSFHELDLTSASGLAIYGRLIAETEVIIPLAGLVGAPVCDKFKDLAWQINHHAIRYTVKCMRPEQRIIYPNTNSGYGQTDGERFCTEEDPLNPISVYGKSKCAGEAETLSHENSAVLRLATVFGLSPRMRLDLMVNDFTSKLAWRYDNWCVEEGPILKIFEGHAKRNFIHVKDVALCFIHLLNPDLRGVYNLGLPNANLSKLELAYEIADTIAMDRRAIAEGEGEDPDKRNYLVSNDKIIDTGFEPDYGLHYGIREVAKLCEIIPDFGMNYQRMKNV